MAFNNSVDYSLVSIVVPVFNMGDTLEESVQSLLNQSYKNIEIILVDDGSTDNSLEVCRSLSNKDNRIKVIHTPNQGSGPARNEGIRVATGSYIYFPDADDVLSLDAIEVMVDAITSVKGCDLVVFGFRNTKASGEVISIKSYEERITSGEELRQSYSECMGTHTKWGIQGAPWNKFFALNVIKDNNIEYPSLRRHQDEGFIGRYMCYANKIHFIPDILYSYKVNDIKKTWHKYPLNYIDAVIGLNEVRKSTIYLWNKSDIKTKELLQKEYICNIIKSLELAYSPKMRCGFKKKKLFVKEGIDKSNILESEIPSILGSYQRIALNLLKRSISLSLILFYIKTRAEKWGML